MSDASRTVQSSSAALSLPQHRRYLLLGVAGAGMTALAQILEDLGDTVVGTDKSYSSADISMIGHSSTQRRMVTWSPNALPLESVDTCVFTPALTADCPLLRAVRNAGLPTQTLHECLSQIFHSKKQLCVAGTHGKTTTSAMLSWILQHTEQDPGYFVGGESIDTHRSGGYGAGDWAVLESCEFSNSFQNFRPQTLLLTGIERDHFDCFPGQKEEDDAFANFISRMKSDGTLILNGNCARSAQVAASVSQRTVTVGVEGMAATDCDWMAKQVDVSALGTSFTCHYAGKTLPVRLGVPGRHNVKNAIAAIAAAAEAGVAPNDSAAALEAFSGVRRRFELRGRPNGVTVIDDYAHHPTAIRETVITARALFPGRRVVLVFEPHQAVRTLALFSDFVEALRLADETLVLPVFPARENISHLECCRISGQLVKELNRRESKAFLFANLDQVVSRIDHSGRPSDVFIAMGAGRTNLIYDQLTRRLQRHSVA